MQTKQQVLQACTTLGNLVKLPDVQLDRALYLEVKTAMENIGGKWKGGKIKGFVFDIDPSELLQELAEGKDRNLKKEYQFFETPPDLAARLVKLANIDNTPLRILEPSAGRGAIIRAITDTNPEQLVHCYELQETNRKLLEKIPGVVVLGDDFLQARPLDLFDRIIANPPFAGNHDLLHIGQMYRHLANRGRLVSVASQHWQFAKGKKEKLFRHWLQVVNGEVVALEAGLFKASGTLVPATIIIIEKNTSA